MSRNSRACTTRAASALMPALAVCAFTALAGAATLRGSLEDPQGVPVSGASVRVLRTDGSPAAATTTAADGSFSVEAPDAGPYTVRAEAEGFVPVVGAGAAPLRLRFRALAESHESVSVTAAPESDTPPSADPGARVLAGDDLLQAGAGRPGAPLSIPGLPIETASGGVKAPQYFAPGVAGDHGEPIATFFRVGTYLVPNNLSANAHGNGYSDPNAIVPSVVESVQVDAGAFDVREGNHSVDLSQAYGFRSRLEPMVAFSGDSRDADVTALWSPVSTEAKEWIAIEAAWGNGLLRTPEHRRQFKLNAYRAFDAGSHRITLFGAGYFGESKVPGLVPIGVAGSDDTIDPRQRDRTHTGEIAANDIWHLTPAGDLQLSAFFRTYNLALDSNFGDGLIRQSEFRTVSGANLTHAHRIGESLLVTGGVDFLRDAPRRLDLDRYSAPFDPARPAYYGPFQPVTANNVTLDFLSPYVSLAGRLTPWMRYYAGWRRDQIDFDNSDLLNRANSYARWAGVNSPKATIDLTPPESLLLPSVAFSYGETFYTNDPRVGMGTLPGTPVSRAHAWQAVVSRTVARTELRLTLARVTEEQSLARIDPDTGLQYNQGPGRNRVLTASARRYFADGMFEASVAKADARDLSTGMPTPEAPRLIIDILGALYRLPGGLRARAEYDAVGRKPLGDGFTGVPVREFRGAVTRILYGGRAEAGLNFLVANGYTGQTTEVLAAPGDSEPFERIVGVRLASYVAGSWTWRFRR